MAHSPNALQGIIDFGNALNKGELNKKEVQAIDLVISEENECQYCLAAHTAVAKMLGFTEEDTIKLRKATIDDPKLRALTQLAKEILNRKGIPSEEYINNFFSAGYSKAALVELIGHISNMIFNNYKEAIMACSAIVYGLEPKEDSFLKYVLLNESPSEVNVWLPAYVKWLGESDPIQIEEAVVDDPDFAYYGIG